MGLTCQVRWIYDALGRPLLTLTYAEFDALISRLENDHITDALKERPGASATPGRPPTAGPSTSKRQKPAAAASSNLQMDTSFDSPAATTYSPPTYRLPAQQTSRPPSQTASPTVNLFSSSTDMSTGMATSERDKADALTSSLAKACSVVEGEVLGDIRSRMQAGMIHGSLQHIQAHEDNVQNLFSRVRVPIRAAFPHSSLTFLRPSPPTTRNFKRSSSSVVRPFSRALPAAVV